jgi:transcription elongation factor Elf1
VERRRYKILKAASKRMIAVPFECPSCGADLYFSTDSKRQKVVTAHSQYKTSGEWDMIGPLLPVDYYNKLVDELRDRTIEPV